MNVRTGICVGEGMARTDKMAQLVKSFATKSDGPELNPSDLPGGRKEPSLTSYPLTKGEL